MTGLTRALLPGLGGMANIHPLPVHFPIALYSAFFPTELIVVVFKKKELRDAAEWLLYLGTLGAIGTVATGLRAPARSPMPAMSMQSCRATETWGLSCSHLVRYSPGGEA